MDPSAIQLSLLLGLLASPVVPLFHAILIRTFRRGNVRLMMVAFFLYAVLWFFLSLYCIGQISPDWIIAGLSLTGFMALGYAEAFSMISRGFSLHILIDVYVHGTRTFRELLTQYRGKGIQWLIEKRIHNLTQGALVIQKNSTLFLAPRGMIIGKTGNFIKQFLSLGKGG